MTLGTRIAQKRKELGLSQESLGEQLGVSRQAIYKWESDASLPEIEKLIALSNLFGVSVGWLLGAEEAPPPQAEQSELTEAQLKMVEEIVNRYLAAQPKPKPRRKWPWGLLGFAVLMGVMSLVNRLDRIDTQYNRLQMTVSSVEESVDRQIGGITDRVEEILKSQNDLTAEYGTAIKTTDLAHNNITFTLRATPKTYVEGMRAKFSVHNGNGATVLEATSFLNQEFSADITCVLTDSLTLSVMFLYPDGTQQNQVLDTYDGLLTASYPYLDIHSSMPFIMTEVPDGTLTLENAYITTRNEGAKSFEGCPAAEIAEVQLGIFRNRKLLGWATPTEPPAAHDEPRNPKEQFYLLPNLTIENLTGVDKLYVAALVTDSYGRQFMVSDTPYVVRTDTSFDTPYLSYPSDGRYDTDPANWEFE